MSNKEYKIYLSELLIGTTELEKADAPMGVAFGRIKFNQIESPYKLFREHCLKNNIVIDIDEPELELISTQSIPELSVLRQDGLEIKGIAENSITGMKDEGYEITILGIGYPFYEEEFPNHVEEYNNMFKKP